MSKKKKRRLYISVNEREHATILVALRLKVKKPMSKQRRSVHIMRLSVPLGNKEIDALCERINFTSRKT